MCESKVVMKKGENEEVIIEEAIRIEVYDDILKIFGILGEKKEVKGKLILVDLQNHKVVVE
ncbi:MAG TPA: CooT family nickel-binding protein [Archaeoglobaceae archaeon]|nr:CooT family nickel-binding protein [Archaeoglobaceae archaeon]